MGLPTLSCVEEGDPPPNIYNRGTRAVFAAAAGDLKTRRDFVRVRRLLLKLRVDYGRESAALMQKFLLQILDMKPKLIT